MSLLSSIIHNHPIVLLLKGSEPETNEIISILASQTPALKIAPMCVDFEVRGDAAILEKQLIELTGKNTPALYVGGVYLGDKEQISELHNSGKLNRLLQSENLLLDAVEDNTNIDDQDERAPSGTRKGRRQSRFRL